MRGTTATKTGKKYRFSKDGKKKPISITGKQTVSKTHRKPFSKH